MILVKKEITDEALKKSVRIDMILPLSDITQKLYQEINKLKPFGVANPEPVFVTDDVIIDDIRTVGNTGDHLKLVVHHNQKNSEPKPFGAIGFGMGDRFEKLNEGDRVSIVYSIMENVWNGYVSLQLKMKDFSSKAS